MSSFNKRLLAWFDKNGRHDLPWQHKPTAYSVWISEIMLQQTQVATVIAYFDRFIAHFPSVSDLAAADLDEVLHLWSGLGYYARGRNLHRTACVIDSQYGGVLPRDLEALIALPGIGRSTAGAILALAHGDRHPILDGNVKRVLARYHEVEGWTGEPRVQKLLWRHAETHTPHKRVGHYTQAIMDLGATVCSRSKPKCNLCPLGTTCDANASGTQDQYPTRKKRKPLPLKSTRFLVARTADDQVLLWRRPAVGVWGGLWSFPEVDDDENIELWCDRVGLLLASEIVERAVITHTFTHFRLAITPLAFNVTNNGRSVMDSDRWLWYNSNDPARIGLATPVTRLLRASLSEK
jgi:A/G-specific adenine glycosylase